MRKVYGLSIGRSKIKIAFRLSIAREAIKAAQGSEYALYVMPRSSWVAEGRPWGPAFGSLCEMSAPMIDTRGRRVS